MIKKDKEEVKNTMLPQYEGKKSYVRWKGKGKQENSN